MSTAAASGILSGSAARRRLRAPALVVLGLAALYAITQVLPSGQSGISGTPSAILFRGLVAGMVNALTAVGIVLVYRTSRIINFGQAAVGAAGAILCFELIQLTPVPFPVAVLLGLVAAAVLGLGFDLVFGRRFARAPRLVLTVLTIVVAQFLGQSSVDFVRGLPIFPPMGSRSAAELTGATSLSPLLPFPSFYFHVGSFPIRFGFVHLFAIGTAATLLITLAALLRYTRMGVAVRAVAENTERAALLGISVGMVSSVVWAAAGVLSGAGVTLTGLLVSPAAAQGFAPDVLLPGLAAAVIGRMRNIGVTAMTSVCIAVLSESIRFRYPDQLPLLDLGLFLVVALGLLLHGRQGGRSESASTSSWQATDEVRPIPRELKSLPSIRVARYGLVAAGLAAVIVFPFVTSADQVNLGAVIALDAIVGLSLVVLTGWAGQVSLGQFGFAALGAVLAGAMASRVGLSFWIAVPVATVATGVFAALIAIPALRINGLFLAATTFAFAVAVRSVLFDPTYFGWLLPGAVRRPTFFVIDFDDERSMYFLCLACLVLTIMVVTNLRRGRFGRVLIAVRENENNAASQGLSPVSAKLMAFALAGALAGFAGAVLAFQERGVNAESFAAAASFGVFIQVVVGGVGTVGGALLGAAYINGTTYLLSGYPIVATLLGSGGTLYLLYVEPGGLMALAIRVRDGILRIIAQRNQLVVPSLFADIDPAALRMRLGPLAPRSEGSGLDAVRRRYTLGTSLLAHADGIRAGTTAQPDVSREAAVIQAAGRDREDAELVAWVAEGTS